MGAADAGLGTYRLVKGPGSTSEQEMTSAFLVVEPSKIIFPI